MQQHDSTLAASSYQQLLTRRDDLAAARDAAYVQYARAAGRLATRVAFARYRAAEKRWSLAYDEAASACSRVEAVQYGAGVRHWPTSATL